MVEVQQSSIAAIQASTSPEAGVAAKMKSMVVSSVLSNQGDATKEVLFELANVAMLKLNGILKSKDGKKQG